MTRYIGIRHRVKKTADDEARPTQVYILEEDLILELEDDNAELDWVRGTFPVSFREIQPDEDLSVFNPRHIQWRTVRKTEDLAKLNPAHLREVDGKTQIATKVPDTYDGLKAGDVYAMSLGGSGDRLAFALSKVGEKMGATVLRLPPSILKDRRGDASKDEDPKLLAKLAQTEPNLFHEVTANTRAIILVRERQSLRIDAMKARTACEQRLRQSLIGSVFCREDEFAELDIEAQFKKLTANDRILGTLVDEEARRIKDLDRAIQQTAVWQRIFDNVKGIGPALAGRLISSIGGIERFLVEPDQSRMDELYEESVRLEREAGLNDLKQFVEPGATQFDTLRRVASWCANNGRHNQAAQLERAVACHQERSKLRQKARKSTQAKLKKFCGVAVMPDGRFPRRRAGQVANWHPDARQALWLFVTEQVNRHGDRTPWGKMLLEYKKKLRATHPEVICKACNLPWNQCRTSGSPETMYRLPSKEVVAKYPQIDRVVVGSKVHTKAYTDGHILKMAQWRTVTKFVEWLADEWSKLARQQKLEAARTRRK